MVDRPYSGEPLADAELSAVNLALEPIHRKRLAGCETPRLPVLFIIGLPRSGTTYLSQGIAAATNIGYITNFVARFWSVPALAMSLERSLGHNPALSDFASRFGATSGWSGPHEFGFFWRRWFAFGECHYVGEQALACVDQAALRSEIAGMQAVAGAPMLFKNLAACGMHAAFLAETLPTALFLVVTRHHEAVARSIARARIQREGGIDRWFSVIPPGLKDRENLAVAEQIFQQIEGIEAHLAEQLRLIQPERTRLLHHAQITRNPLGVAQAVAGWLAERGGAVQGRALPPDAVRTPRREPEILDPALLASLADHYAQRRNRPNPITEAGLPTLAGVPTLAHAER